MNGKEIFPEIIILLRISLNVTSCKDYTVKNYERSCGERFFIYFIVHLLVQRREGTVQVFTLLIFTLLLFICLIEICNKTGKDKNK